MNTLTIELTPEEELRLDAEARRRGTDRAGVARDALEQILAPVRTRRIADMEGIGHGTWDDVDVVQHINEMRDEWDAPQRSCI